MATSSVLLSATHRLSTHTTSLLGGYVRPSNTGVAAFSERAKWPPVGHARANPGLNVQYASRPQDRTIKRGRARTSATAARPEVSVHPKRRRPRVLSTYRYAIRRNRLDVPTRPGTILPSASLSVRVPLPHTTTGEFLRDAAAPRRSVIATALAAATVSLGPAPSIRLVPRCDACAANVPAQPDAHVRRVLVIALAVCALVSERYVHYAWADISGPDEWRICPRESTAWRGRCEPVRVRVDGYHRPV